MRRAALRAYVGQTSGWDDAEQRITADREFADLPFAVVEESGRAVGYACVIHQSKYDFVEEIALLPEAQGRGIGTHLLRGIHIVGIPGQHPTPHGEQIKRVVPDHAAREAGQNLGRGQ
ncbi:MULTISPECIES: GNAT family N-acetyltransferase [Frankia]|uniref:N-acetyltransferase domain-containing protein n=1 Tax=Frankia alni (strain DSM 45986 / CECT 9034 / ACN14a) TaxID=326424 RepID=Q0RFW8_FRAAA|nr:MULTISPECIES: GNAT family N-acetyltransferase [Frankia]CAJ63622.1 hypothetical protein; putative Acyl-CoA N-acyltransferases domain [Frankia alni ACN14a]